MAEYKWPEAEKRRLIGKRISRVDGPLKVSGKAKYAFDYNGKELLFGKILRSPYAAAKVVSIDTSVAEKMPGVKAVKVIQGPGTEIKWAGDEIVAVAAVDEPTAEDAVRAIKVEYERLPHVVNEEDLSAVPDANKKPANDRVQGDPDKAFSEAEVTVEGLYGNSVITHCCLESHGQTVEWTDENNVLIHPSTQAVSVIGNDLAQALGIPAGNVQLKMDFIGGGFGSKFPIDRWGIECAKISKMAGGKPVKIMLERDAELMVAGSRPSMFAKVKIGAKKDGTITAWQSEAWGTGGPAGLGAPPLPYMLNTATGIPHQRVRYTSVSTNTGPQRAWRAPNHPQMALITMGALEDLAAELKMDPVDFLLKNIDLFKPRSEMYSEELAKAAELIEWKKNWRPRGEGAPGSTKTIKRGLGVSMHTWGGGGHASNCDVIINPDGSVDLKMGSQELGTGTKTILMIVAAETLGLPLEAINVHLGDNRYPSSGASGGSTTVGGVSSAARRGSVDALNQLFAKVAPTLEVKPEELEAADGRIRVASNPSKSMTWKEACAKLGSQPITVRGVNKQGDRELTNSGVGGVQMADVSVDTETGIVKMNKFVAVQDCGLVLDLKTAESQVYGAMIMGVTYSLFEEKIMDRATGRMLNPNMEFYKLAGAMDIGEFKVHMMTGKGYDERGVIGLGEPPTNSPGAAISNAVANAIGVRVPTIPLTPDRVLAALASKKGGTSNAKI
ncbi:MAG TPA: xanthine dehydrogenase family protein molybdopterin-binding subunit [Blastocatellia bacterium]|nr:xanthine dehydrogenase family protein molybdopterin-binding subunit [Blastocatellia bacterium]